MRQLESLAEAGDRLAPIQAMYDLPDVGAVAEPGPEADPASVKVDAPAVVPTPVPVPVPVPVSVVVPTATEPAPVPSPDAPPEERAGHAPIPKVAVDVAVMTVMTVGICLWSRRRG